MFKPSKPNVVRMVGEFFLDLNPIAITDTSKVYSGRNEDSPTNDYAIQCIPLVEYNRNKQIIDKQINNALKYKSTNALIEFRSVLATSKNLYLFYTYFESHSLLALLSPTIQLSQERKLIIAQNIAEKINLLHKYKMMHTNLNPEHILVSNSNSSILFCGLKSIRDFADNILTEIAKKEPYYAPEIRDSKNLGLTYTEKVDIFSF